jgi:hypothetical protein
MDTSDMVLSLSPESFEALEWHLFSKVSEEKLTFKAPAVDCNRILLNLIFLGFFGVEKRAREMLMDDEQEVNEDC